MQIEVSKSELAGALSALGKLVCRTSPVEVYRSLRIEGKENKISFQTVGLDDAITYTLPVDGVEEFCVVVNFDEFRTVVRYGRSKSVVLVYEGGRFGVDSTLMRTSHVDWPTERVENGDCEVAELPRLFIGYLSELAPIVNRNDYRQVLRGIHFCKDGLVATNGKELLHISLYLPVENLTIPFPHAALATKSEDAGRVVTWCENEYRYFRFEFGNWRWTGKALFGSYPNWRNVIPDAEYLNHVVKFNEDEADRLTAFLKTVPDNPPNNPVTLSMGNNSTLVVVPETGMRFDIHAEFPCDWGDFKITVNKLILQRLLGEGHHRISFGEAKGPFIAQGGIGRYLAMPLASHTEKVVQPQKQQEEKEMNESIPNNVTAPMPPVANTINPEPIVVNPLDELATAIDEFKARLRAMFDESTLLSRKVKEVALAQKQKEREFVQAKRAIEKIRMAI